MGPRCGWFVGGVGCWWAVWVTGGRCGLLVDGAGCWWAVWVTGGRCGLLVGGAGCWWVVAFGQRYKIGIVMCYWRTKTRDEKCSS